MLEKQQKGEVVLGRETFKRKALVIMTDRSEDALIRTFRRMGIDKSVFPFVVVRSMAAKRKGVAQVVAETVEKYQPHPEVVVIEGLDILIGDDLSGPVVAPVLESLHEVAMHLNIAIIATVGCPKMKPREAYQLAREKVIGSQVWGE
jgi:hypothetical protein